MLQWNCCLFIQFTDFDSEDVKVKVESGDAFNGNVNGGSNCVGAPSNSPIEVVENVAQDDGHEVGGDDGDVIDDRCGVGGDDFAGIDAVQNDGIMEDVDFPNSAKSRVLRCEMSLSPNKHSKLLRQRNRLSKPNINLSIDSCRFCLKIVPSRKHRGHMLKHACQNRFKCNRCPLSFFWKYNLNAHLCLHKTKQSKRKVAFAMKSKSIQSMKRCDIKLTKRDGKISFKFTTEPKRKKVRRIFQCSICGKEFSCQNHLSNHMYMHTDERPFECEICRKFYKSEKQRKTHIQRVHQGIYKEKSQPVPFPHACGICGRTFSTLTQMCEHKVIHKSDTPFLCEICNCDLKTKEGLRKHVSNTHGTYQLHPCDICDKFCRTRKSLEDHHRRQHRNSIVVCHLCPKTFKNKCLLEKHMRRHSDERPFPCKDCGKAFKTRSDLKLHSAVHSTERPFECPICGQR